MILYRELNQWGKLCEIGGMLINESKAVKLAENRELILSVYLLILRNVSLGKLEIVCLNVKLQCVIVLLWMDYEW